MEGVEYSDSVFGGQLGKPYGMCGFGLWITWWMMWIKTVDMQQAAENIYASGGI